MQLTFRRLLFLICAVTDFVGFLVVFAVSRGLAEHHAGPQEMGRVGAIFSFSAGVASILSGLLTQRVSSRIVFLTGATTVVASILPGTFVDRQSSMFLPCYWLLAAGLGLLYPPLIGWLNQDTDPHANHRGVSRTLVLFCIAWNAGVMCGQLVAGTLFARGTEWIYWAAVVAALLNLALGIAAACRVTPPVVSSVAAAPVRLGAAELSSVFKRLSWIANIGGMFGASLVIHLLPELAVDLGIPSPQHGRVLAAWRVVVIATYVCMHRSAFWHFRLGTSLISQALGACGLMVIAGAQSALGLFVGLALLGQLMGYNYFSGLFYSTAGSSTQRRALAAGIHEATLAAGMAVGTMVGGVVGELINDRVPYILSAGVLVVLMILQGTAWQRWSTVSIRDKVGEL